MDPRLIFEIISGALAIGSGVVTLRIALNRADSRTDNANLLTEIAKLRTEMAQAHAASIEARIKEREELRIWINGSFMRSATVEKVFTDFERRLQNVEDIAS